MTDEHPVDTAPPQPSIKARATILLIGAVALGGIVLMCLIVLFLAVRS